MTKDKPGRANAVVRVLSAALSFARDDLLWSDTSPCQKLKLPKGGDGQAPYSKAELRRFRDVEPLGARARLAFEMQLATAVRITASTHVETDSLRGDVLAIASHKTSILTVAVATDQLRMAFDAWAEARDLAGTPLGRYALGGRDGKPLNRRTLSKDLEKAYKKAGFPPEKQTHALRYTAATRLLKAGYGIEEIQEVTGHKMAAMALKYCQKKRAAARAAGVFNRFDQAGLITG